MAHLIMKDGSKVPMADDEAKRIWSMMNGFLSPKSQKQRNFIATIQEVSFDPGSPAPQPQAETAKIADERVRQILADTTLKGWEKMQRINLIIRERHNKRRVYEAH